MNIAVIGTGYVGLVTEACFAESGNDVICVDIDAAKITKLNHGEIPIYEPGLKELIANNQEARRIQFTTDTDRAVRDSEIIFIAVGTPGDTDGSADLTQVLKVAAQIGRVMNRPKIIVNKSTVPVGTADLVRAEVAKHTKLAFDVVSNPEFLKEGSAIDDFMRPDRVVIGTSSEESAAILRELYSPFVRTDNPILVMDVRSAEVTKYAANACLATRVSFMNEIANLCESVGADINSVRRGIGSDQRIGPSFLFAGVGYGGSCFPKDVKALLKTSEKYDTPLRIVAAVDTVNQFQKKRVPAQIVKHWGSGAAIQGRCFAVWGSAFKPKTDDMREAPSIAIIRELIGLGARIRAYDPEATENAKLALSDLEGAITYQPDSYSALEGADALVIVTEWNEFRRPNFDKVKKLLNQPIIFDGRNLFDPAIMRRSGFTYYSIGRQPVIS